MQQLRFKFYLSKIKRTIRIRYILNCFYAFLFDKVNQKREGIKKNTLLLIRLDAIGDYVLFRNLLATIRKSEKFKNHKITVAGNYLWKDIALTYDKDFVDEWYWIDTNKLIQDKNYRKSVLMHLYKQGFETAIFPNSARDFLKGDILIRATKATYRVGSASSKSIDAWLFTFIGSFFYTRLIDNKEPIFEFDKNVYFFKILLEQEISLTQPTFPKIDKIEKQKQILILPGAGEKKRQWSSTNFARLIQKLNAELPNYKIVINGGKSDIDKVNEIITLIPEVKIENETGKHSLVKLIEHIQQSSLVIAHDSSGYHFAVACYVPIVGLMPGKRYKRFSLYSCKPNNTILHFPITVNELDTMYEKFGESFFEDVLFDINSITPDSVYESCKKLLTNENLTH